MSDTNSAMYISIKDLSKELSLPSHVLRFWETKFKCIKPIKRSGGCRYYRPIDVENIKRIKCLLYEEKYTIKGAIALLQDDCRNKANKNKDKTDAIENTTLADNQNKPKIEGIVVEQKMVVNRISPTHLAKLKTIRDSLKLAISES